MLKWDSLPTLSPVSKAPGSGKEDRVAPQMKEQAGSSEELVLSRAVANKSRGRSKNKGADEGGREESNSLPGLTV